MKISIGADHGGYDLKQALIAHLEKQGHTVSDFGTQSRDSVDYPDFSKAVGESISNKETDYGVLICTSGIGVSIAANKITGVRAGMAFNEDMAMYMKLHNDANIICFGQKYITAYMASKMLDMFLATNFEGGRHQRRVEKIKDLES